MATENGQSDRFGTRRRCMTQSAHTHTHTYTHIHAQVNLPSTKNAIGGTQ